MATQSFMAGEWFTAILVGTKKAKFNEKKTDILTQQLILKPWRYLQFKDAWQSAEETKKREEHSADVYVTDIRIEVMKTFPPTNSEFHRLYNQFKPPTAQFLDTNLRAILNSEMWARRFAASDQQTLLRVANYIMDFSAINLYDFRKKDPSIQFWVNDFDITWMMRFCILDLLITKIGLDAIMQKPVQGAIGAATI